MKILIAFLVVALQKNSRPMAHEYCRTIINQWVFDRVENSSVGRRALPSFVLLVLIPVLCFFILRPIADGGWALLLNFLFGFLTLMTVLTLHKLRRRIFRFRRAWVDHNEPQMRELAINDWHVEATLDTNDLHNNVIDRMFIGGFEQAFVYLFWYWFVGVEGLLFYFLFQVWFAAAHECDAEFQNSSANRWVGYVASVVGLINNIAARLLALSFLFSGNAWGGLRGALTDSFVNLSISTNTLVVNSARSTLSLDYLKSSVADNTLLGKQQIIMTRRLISRTLGVWFIGFALLSILVP
ncbi:MAG: hypothetical protein COB04_05580 [Gammaproteobacteria bacterium]|nr:MAG: hypothetical protein COB04_05580 [Gammaproteobacteria bacterium]